MRSKEATAYVACGSAFVLAAAPVLFAHDVATFTLNITDAQPIHSALATVINADHRLSQFTQFITSKWRRVPHLSRDFCFFQLSHIEHMQIIEPFEAVKAT